MFGLDARIALAIFGALSVISGAALYSAIKQAKVVAAVAELNEISKAVESYMLDVGEDLEQDDVVSSFKKITHLLSSSKQGWSGPYLAYSIMSADHTLKHNYFTAVQLVSKDTLIWPVVSDSSNDCFSGNGCYYWIIFSSVDNALAKAIDEYVDGTADRYKGKIRLVYASNDTSSPTSHLFMQSIPVLSR